MNFTNRMSFAGFALAGAALLVFGPAALPVAKALAWGIGISVIGNLVYTVLSKNAVTSSQYRPATLPANDDSDEDEAPRVRRRTNYTVERVPFITSTVPTPTIQHVSSTIVPAAATPPTTTIQHVSSKVVPASTTTPVSTTVSQKSSTFVPAHSATTTQHVKSKIVSIKTPKPLYPQLPIFVKPTSPSRTDMKKAPVVHQTNSSFIPTKTSPNTTVSQTSSTFHPTAPAVRSTPTYTPARSSMASLSSNNSNSATTTKTSSTFVPTDSSTSSTKQVSSTFVPLNK